MAPKATDTTQQPITRGDLERRFGAFQQTVQGKVADRKANLATITGIGGAILLIVVFLVGRRAGKRKRTFVEIRRL